MKSIRLLAAVLAIALGAFASVGRAQTANTGAITGSVLDATGAAVQNVQVEVTSETTGETRKVLTDIDGVYRVPLLPPGSYRIEASASGFKVAVRPGVPVRVTETTGLNIRLEVGSVGEVVNVDATPQLTQTDSNALGRVTDEKSVKNLPLVSRNFTQIIGLSPGVSVGLTDATQLGTGNGGMSNFSNEDLSVNGARSYDNNFQMDGVTANEQVAVYQWTGGIAIPNPDSIAEFKVQTGQYDASYGRNAGANVNVVTKSGSNQFHGNVFEFFRNEDLNANSFFFNADGVPRGVLRQNQFGGTFGGPIVKDRLLFFTSYQGTRQLNGFSASCGATFVGPALTNDRSAAALGALYGGQTGALGGVAVAPDGSNINSVALNLLNLKLPNGSYAVPTPQKIVDGGGRYAFSDPCPFHEDQFMSNVDFLQSVRSKFAAKFFFSDQGYTQSLSISNVPGSPDVFTPDWRNLSLTHDYVFSSNLLNQVEFGFHRIAATTKNASSFTFPGIGSSVIPQARDLAVVLVGQEALGSWDNTFVASNVLTLQDTLTYTHGRHSMSFGGGATRTAFQFDWVTGSRITFLSVPDLLLGLSAAQNGSSFSNVYGVWDFPGQTNRNDLVWNPWLYAQDNFKVNPRLTLNLGLRYERVGDFTNPDGLNSGFNPALASPNPPASGSQAGYVVASGFKGTLPAGSVRSNSELAINGDGQSTFGPRVGFAWQVLPNSGRLVLRGGYGVYYSPFVGLQTIWTSLGAPPWGLSRNISGLANAGATWAAPFGQLYSESDFPVFPAYSPSTQLSTIFLAPNSRPPVTQEYSLNLQTQLANNYLLEIGYVGSRGTHLVETVTSNQAEMASPSNPIRGQTTNTLANLQLRVPIEGFTTTGLTSIQTEGESWFNSLQVSLTKRFSRGLQFLSSYSYSRLLDTEGGNTINTAGVGLVPGNQYSPAARYGPSTTVRPHRFVVSFVYDLPKLVKQGFAGTVLNGWSLSGVTTVLSGHPLSIYSTNANNAFGINEYGGDFAEWAPGCTKSQLATPGSVRSKLSNYFNTACIGAYPVIGSDGIATGFGNMGPGLVNGPGMSNIDLALTKRTPVRWLGRESNWEFRAEFFNTLNTPHFSDPDTNPSDGAAFGVISSTIANPRIIQLALKYNF